MIGAVLLAVACESYFIDDPSHRLMRVDGQGVVSVLLTDEKEVGHARLSPDRRTILYDERLHEGGQNFAATFVLVDRRTGTRLRTFDVEDPGNAVMDFGWVNSDVIWIDGHWSPRCGYYGEVNVKSGRVTRHINAETFARSPRGTIAYTGCQGSRSHKNFLFIGNHQLYPPQGDHTAHIFGWTYHWSPNGRRIAIADSNPVSGTTDVVILSRSGSIVRKVRVDERKPGTYDPLDIDPVGKVRWLDDDHLVYWHEEVALRISNSGRVASITLPPDPASSEGISWEGNHYDYEDATCGANRRSRFPIPPVN